jgi:hypothetical protein
VLDSSLGRQEAADFLDGILTLDDAKKKKVHALIADCIAKNIAASKRQAELTTDPPKSVWRAGYGPVRAG